MLDSSASSPSAPAAAYLLLNRNSMRSPNKMLLLLLLFQASFALDSIQTWLNSTEVDSSPISDSSHEFRVSLITHTPSWLSILLTCVCGIGSSICIFTVAIQVCTSFQYPLFSLSFPPHMSLSHLTPFRFQFHWNCSFHQCTSCFQLIISLIHMLYRYISSDICISLSAYGIFSGNTSPNATRHTNLPLPQLKRNSTFIIMMRKWPQLLPPFPHPKNPLRAPLN